MNLIVDNLSKNGEFTISTTTMTNSVLTHTYGSQTAVIGTPFTASYVISGNNALLPIVLTPTTVFKSKVFKVNGTNTFALNATDSFSISLNTSCSLDGSVVFSHALSQFNNTEVPSWVKLNGVEGTLSGKIPRFEVNQTFSFYVNTSWTDIPAGSSSQLVRFDVKGQPTVIIATKMAIAAGSAQVAGAVGIGITASILSGAPPMSLWTIMQQLQMVILLLLIDNHTPEDVDEYLGGMSFIMFNFNFIPIKSLPYVDVPTNWMEFGQPLDKLQTLGLESRSTFVNNISLLFTFLLTMTVHIFLKCLPCFKNVNHSNCIVRNISNARFKLLDLIFYIMYARLLLEAHETLILTSTVEINDPQTDSTPTITSHVIAWSVLILCFIIPSVALYAFYSHRKQYDPDKQHVFMEFFAGLRNSKWARLYTASLLIRRISFV